jgi:hypothetical protein
MEVGCFSVWNKTDEREAIVFFRRSYLYNDPGQVFSRFFRGTVFVPMFGDVLLAYEVLNDAALDSFRFCAHTHYSLREIGETECISHLRLYGRYS